MLALITTGCAWEVRVSSNKRGACHADADRTHNALKARGPRHVPIAVLGVHAMQVLSLVRITLVVVLYLHWSACVWGTQLALQGGDSGYNLADTWVGSGRYCVVRAPSA